MAAPTPSRLEKLRAAFAASARAELALCHYAEYDAAIAASWQTSAGSGGGVRTSCGRPC